MTMAVIALDLASSRLDLPSLLRGTARRFQPHITLLPRFPLHPEHHGRAFARSIADLGHALTNIALPLSGPHWPEADLGWYEPEAEGAGRALLKGVHASILREELRTGRIATEPRFSGSAFHPHMTVVWRAEAQGPEPLPTRIHAHAIALSLYSYDGDPHVDAVRRRVLVAWPSSDGSPRASR